MARCPGRALGELGPNVGELGAWEHGSHSDWSIERPITVIQTASEQQQYVRRSMWDCHQLVVGNRGWECNKYVMQQLWVGKELCMMLMTVEDLYVAWTTSSQRGAWE